ncbi:MAG TPA: nuclear transport factor 2 family protein [Polyangia bacterium]|nr:nuclear transport factor 2 family protein [Polyangia bacterium]
MPHTNETLLRQAYDLFARGDVPGFLALCAPDIRFKVPGHNRLSGEHTVGAFLDVLGPAMQVTGNTFRERVVYLAANDTDGFVLAAQKLERDGKLYEWNAAHHWRIAGGKLTQFWEFVDDERTYDAAWR